MTLLPAYTLWRREIVAFLRQRNRVMAALLQPAVLWVLFGAGFSGSFRLEETPGGENFLEYLFPGTVLLVVLFTSIFSTFSLIKDRNEGFLQTVLVAPVSSSGIVLGKIFGGATLAMMQGLVFLLLGPLVGVPLTVGSFLAGAAVLALISFWLTALGLAVAWPMESIQGFHAIMMLFLMPMWLLSGAFFPLEGAPLWLGWVMRLNPLTYGMSAFRQALYGTQVPGIAWDSWSVSVGVTVAVSVALFVLSLIMVGRRTRGSAR